MQLRRTTKGFSMIEAVIYLGLATFLISSIIVSSYPLFTNTERETQATVRDVDTAFVTQKIIGVLNSASSITTPTVGTSGSTLTAVTPLGTVTMAQTGTSITFDRGTGATPITSSRVSVSSLLFARTAGVGGAPDTFTFGFTINGVAVPSIIRYVRN